MNFQKKDIKSKEETINEDNNKKTEENNNINNNINTDTDTNINSNNSNMKSNNIDNNNKDNNNQNDLKNDDHHTIKTNSNNNNINNDNVIINNNDNKDITPNGNEESPKIVYSYECMNIVFLSAYIYEGTQEANIDIILKNNGEYSWPLNSTKLICDKKESNFIGNEIMLDPQKPGEEKEYRVTLTNLGNSPKGEYEVYYWFYINDNVIDEKLKFRIIIIKENKIENEIEQYMEKIEEFREIYDISEDDYSNEKIFKLLKANNFNFESSFIKFLE